MSEYHWLLLAHLLGAFLYAGGGVVAAVLYAAAARRRRPSEVALLLGQVRLILPLVGLGVLAVLVFGIWLAEYLNYGAGAGWVLAAIVLWAVSQLFGAVGGRRDKATRVLAERLAQEGDAETGELRARLLSPVSLAIHAGDVAILTALLVDMVWKPGA